MSIDYSYYSLLLPLSGDDAGTEFTDWGPENNIEPSVVGDAKTSTAQSKFYGSAAFFDGAGDYLNFPSNPFFGFGTADFTVGGWFYPTATTGADRTLLDFRSAANTPAAFFLNSSTAKLSVWTGTLFGDSGSAVTLDAWQHIEFCRSSGTLYAFLGGVLQWSAAFTADFGAARPLGVGAAIGSGILGNSPFSGYQNDVYVVKGAALHTSGFTPPTSLIKTISGNVLDDTGSPAAARTVFAVPRNHPVRAFKTTTDGSGNYTLDVPDTECSRVVMDDDAGTLYNDIVDRVIPG